MELAKIRHDRNVYAAKFERGDLVWLAVKDNKTGKTKKLRRKWKGPFEILNESKEGPYQIRLTTSKKGAKQTVNRDLLRRCFILDPDRFQTKEPTNKPTETNSEEIQRILEIDFFERNETEPANQEMSPEIADPNNKEPTSESGTMQTNDANETEISNPNSNQQPQSKIQTPISTITEPITTKSPHTHISTQPHQKTTTKRGRGRPPKIPRTVTEPIYTETTVAEAEERPKRISKAPQRFDHGKYAK
jgi:hypothetical protein